MPGQQPEQAGGRRGQPPVRPGERRPRVGAPVAGGDDVQPPALRAQLRHQVGRCRTGLLGHPRRHDGQRQRQPRAEPDQLGHHGPVLAGDPAGAQPGGQQRPAAGLVEQVEGEHLGTGVGVQAGQPGPAGHHGAARRGAGQQRPHLVLAVRVLQHDQQPPIGRQAAEEPAEVLLGGRQPVRRDTERDQEAPQHRGGLARRPARVPAEQVGVQLPVRMITGGPPGPVHRQRRLADPGGAVDQHQRRVRLRRAGELGQPFELRVPAGEVAGDGGQLTGHHGDGGRRLARRAQQRVAGPDPVGERAGGRSGARAEPLVRLERRTVVAGQVGGVHQHPDGRLVTGMPGGQAFAVEPRLLGLAAPQPRLGEPGRRLPAFAFQAAADPVGPRPGDPVQCRPAPEGQCAGQLVAGGRPVARGDPHPGGVHRGPEPVHVDQFGRDLQPVRAVRVPGQREPVPPQRGAQVAHVAAAGLGIAARAAPQRAVQEVPGDLSALGQQQHGQHALRLRQVGAAPQGDPVVAVPQPHRTEQPEVHPVMVTSLCLPDSPPDSPFAGARSAAWRSRATAPASSSGSGPTRRWCRVSDSPSIG